nr:WG repeat-containing protein [Bacteroidota bacterium]
MKSKFFLSVFVVACFASINADAQLQRFYENAKVGYKNIETGAVVVPAKYYAGSEFMEGYALVLEGRKRGFIDAKGEVIIPFEYDDASIFYDGVARVMKGGKHGYINMKGETVIPFIYDFADDFKGGLARVSKGGKWVL